MNTASKLASMNKDFNSQLIGSQGVADRADINLFSFELREVEVRGRT